MTTLPTVHKSVLAEEILEFLSPRRGDTVLDATLGGAGHTESLLSIPGVTVIGIDADADAIARAEMRLRVFGKRATLIRGNFRDLSRLLSTLGIASLSHALFDLGLSSDQLEVSGRGFSFMRDEPLQMTFGEPVLGFDARELLNTWSEEGIANALWGYGEERYSRRIARAIVAQRKISPIETTTQLVALIRESVPAAYVRGKTNPATKTFQALRMAVNDELNSIEEGLRATVSHLRPHGRIAVISFHSIEDRTVKRAFRGMAQQELVSIITKKPIVPSAAERSANPRARSAKLRVAEKI